MAVIAGGLRLYFLQPTDTKGPKYYLAIYTLSKLSSAHYQL